MGAHNGKKEAFSRVGIDAQLRDAGWNLTDGQSVRYEYRLPDGTYADYVLSDRHGRALAVVEAKRAAINLQEAAAQGRAYAEQLDDERIAGRDYQKDYIDTLRKEMNAGRRKLLVEMATGTGKTITALPAGCDLSVPAGDDG